MAFGLLGSIIPQVNRNEVVYTSLSSDLVIGKVSISSKNYNPVKIRLGITQDGVNIEYLEYNRFINYGETFETELVHLGNGQKLIARSSDADVNFLFYGQTIDDSPNNNKSGLLGSIISTDTQKQTLYTAPPHSDVNLTLSVCNLDSQPGKARIGISNYGLNAFDSSEYLEYDVEIGPNQTYTRIDIKLSNSQSLICSSSKNSNINFVCHGRFVYDEQLSGAPVFDQLTVEGNTLVEGTLGLGTAFARERLDVIGNTLISGQLNVGGQLNANSGLNVSRGLVAQSGLTVTGIITGNLNPSNLNQSLINLGTLPAINGSALTGVIATGVGVAIQDNGINVGTASTINFGENIKAEFFGGISTVTTSDDVNVVNSFSAASGKFFVNGPTGSTQITGTLGISSSLTVSGNINALNNKVINVGSATSSTDATNKNYVDTRSIAMSIALS
jgi:hypothetical protein